MHNHKLISKAMYEMAKTFHEVLEGEEYDPIYYSITITVEELDSLEFAPTGEKLTWENAFPRDWGEEEDEGGEDDGDDGE